MSQLEEIKARLAAISPGKWEAAIGSTADDSEAVTTRLQKAEYLASAVNDDESQLWLIATDEVIPAVTGDGPRAQANADFIAHAPETQAKLVAALEAVEAVHARHLGKWTDSSGIPWIGEHCTECLDEWPCQTARAITEALQ